MPAKAGGKSGGKGKGAKAKAPKAKGAKKGGKKGRRKAARTWSLYIFKVLKQVHSDTGISNKAMAIMNSFINDIFERLAAEASVWGRTRVGGWGAANSCGHPSLPPPPSLVCLSVFPSLLVVLRRQARQDQQDEDAVVAGDPDRRAPVAAGGAGQARDERGDQGRGQVYLRLKRLCGKVIHSLLRTVFFNTTACNKLSNHRVTYKGVEGGGGRPLSLSLSLF